MQALHVKNKDLNGNWLLTTLDETGISIPKENLGLIGVAAGLAKGTKRYPTIFDLSIGRKRCSRFMYCAEKREPLLSPEAPNYRTHADVLHHMGGTNPYDHYMKGWHGISREYPYGIIHFYMWDYSTKPLWFNRFMNTLETFLALGAGPKCIVRSAVGSEYETPIKTFFPQRFLVQVNEPRQIGAVHYFVNDKSSPLLSLAE